MEDLTLSYSIIFPCSMVFLHIQEFSAADNVTLIIKTQSFHSGDDFHNKAARKMEIMVINRLWQLFFHRKKRKASKSNGPGNRILDAKGTLKKNGMSVISLVSKITGN